MKSGKEPCRILEGQGPWQRELPVKPRSEKGLGSSLTGRGEEGAERKVRQGGGKFWMMYLGGIGERLHFKKELTQLHLFLKMMDPLLLKSLSSRAKTENLTHLSWFPGC